MLSRSRVLVSNGLLVGICACVVVAVVALVGAVADVDSRDADLRASKVHVFERLDFLRLEDGFRGSCDGHGGIPQRLYERLQNVLVTDSVVAVFERGGVFGCVWVEQAYVRGHAVFDGEFRTSS